MSENNMSKNNMSENNWSENNMPSNDDDRLDSALTTMVTTYTDTAPEAPDVNKILVQRAGRPAQSSGVGAPWLRPVLSGAFGLLVLVGGFLAIRAVANNGDGGQTIVPAEQNEATIEESESTEDDGSDDKTSDNSSTVDESADDEQTGDGQSDQVVTPQADLGSLAGAEAAGDLPDAAPSTFWLVGDQDAQLLEVEARTGRILVDAGGWGPQQLGEGDRGQALEQPEISSDGTVYVSDCCEPAYGSVFRFSPGDVFEPGQSAWQQGLYPSASPSGEHVMIAVGASLNIVTKAGESVASLGDPGDSFEGLQFVPLAWIDEQTVAVRIFTAVEEIRIYELEAGRLSERTEARRVVADRFYMDGAVRSDGMLVLATRRPDGDPLGLAGGGDVVGEVIDPMTGELVTEFDLPDSVTDIDYDSSGRFLLTSGQDRLIRWFGAGQSGVLAEGGFSASWD